MSGIYRTAAGAQAVLERYRELLDRWPVANQQLRLPTRAGETFVLACGPENATPLLLLHGSGANAAVWVHDIADWAAHFRVYAVDVIGEPGLSAPARPPLASDAYALWLDDVLHALALGHVAILGVSLGGWLALDYATRRPERVERLVLVSPSGVGRRRLGVLIRLAFLQRLGRWGRRKALAVALGPAPRGTTPHDSTLAAFTMLIFRHFKPRLAPIPTFGDDALRRLTMPLLAIVGGRDAMLDSGETIRRLQRAAAHAEVRLLPEAGHFVRDPAAVLRFLRIR